jgi:hypothetical protein
LNLNLIVGFCILVARVSTNVFLKTTVRNNVSVLDFIVLIKVENSKRFIIKNPPSDRRLSAKLMPAQ